MAPCSWLQQAFAEQLSPGFNRLPFFLFISASEYNLTQIHLLGTVSVVAFL